MNNTSQKIENMNIEIYEKIINIIYDEHSKHTKEWLNKQSTCYNLKKKNICDICNNEEYIKIDRDFKAYMDGYMSTLGMLYMNIVLRVNFECGINIIGRIKNEDSIINKILKKSKQDSGKFPIIKCLNDLLGVRIIDSNYKDNIIKVKEYIDFLNKSDKVKIKGMSRVNGEYAGYHVYFSGLGNNYFNMELQIWDSDNEKTNLNSHETYKKEYTNWPNKYNNLEERSV